jgi:hypothetical protein
VRLCPHRQLVLPYTPHSTTEPLHHTCSLQEKFNKLSQSRAVSPRTLGAVLHVLQQAAQGQLGSPSITIAAYQPLQVPQQVCALLQRASAVLDSSLVPEIASRQRV